jgi:hypothetical protein
MFDDWFFGASGVGLLGEVGDAISVVEGIVW